MRSFRFSMSVNSVTSPLDQVRCFVGSWYCIELTEVNNLVPDCRRRYIRTQCRIDLRYLMQADSSHEFQEDVHQAQLSTAGLNWVTLQDLSDFILIYKRSCGQVWRFLAKEGNLKAIWGQGWGFVFWEMMIMQITKVPGDVVFRVFTACHEHPETLKLVVRPLKEFKASQIQVDGRVHSMYWMHTLRITWLSQNRN